MEKYSTPLHLLSMKSPVFLHYLFSKWLTMDLWKLYKPIKSQYFHFIQSNSSWWKWTHFILMQSQKYLVSFPFVNYKRLVISLNIFNGLFNFVACNLRFTTKLELWFFWLIKTKRPSAFDQKSLKCPTILPTIKVILVSLKWISRILQLNI